MILKDILIQFGKPPDTKRVYDACHKYWYNYRVEKFHTTAQKLIETWGNRVLYEQKINLFNGSILQKDEEYLARKVWIDDEDTSNRQPVTVVLYENGVPISSVALGTSGIGWTYKWTGLDPNKAYTAEEITKVDGYEQTVDHYTHASVFVNTAIDIPEYDNYTVIKKWYDKGYESNRKPVTVDLYKDGVKYKSHELNEDNDWSWTWEKLPIGHKYTVKERNVPSGYTTTYERGKKSTEIINTYDIVTKPSMSLGGYVWEDTPTTKVYEVDNQITGASVDESTGLLNMGTVDKWLQNIKVTLYDASTNAKVELNVKEKTKGGIELLHSINPTLTDENGYYQFNGLDPNKEYYVTFEYNGQIYMPTNKKDSTYNSNDWLVTSKSLENNTTTIGNETRDAYNTRFEEIGSYPANYKIREKLFTNENYTVNGCNASFSQLQLMGYKLNDNGQYKQTEIQLIDGYLYDETGKVTDKYSEGIISKKLKRYIEKYKKYPDDIKTIYNEIIGEASGDKTELRRKLQFICDCQIVAGAKQYPAVDNFVIHKIISPDEYDKLSNKNNYVRVYDGWTKITGVNINVRSVLTEDRRMAKSKVSVYDGQFYINCGLMRRQEADVAVLKEIGAVATKINGKSEIYTYKDLNNPAKIPEDADGNKEIYQMLSDYDAYFGEEYDRKLYKSDYDYLRDVLKSTGEDLEIYVTYRICIRNQNVILTEIKEIVDYYDKEFEFREDLSWINKDKNNEKLNKENYNTLIKAAPKDESKSTNASSATTIMDGNAVEANQNNSSKYGSATESDLKEKYDAVYLQGMKNYKLGSGESVYIFLTFQVKKDDNGKIIIDEDLNTRSIERIEAKQNFVEINGFKTYYPKGTELPNYGTINNDVTSSGLLDIDSNPGNLVKAHIFDANGKKIEKFEKNFEDDTSRAKGLRLRIDVDVDGKPVERQLNGVVWEDERTVESSRAKIGDGIRQDNEKTVSNVTVHLVEKKKVNGIDKEYIWQETITDDAGKYEFKGYIPGDYVVRFYYGNNENAIETTNILQGDVNGDGKISVRDCVLISRYIARIYQPDSDEALRRLDYNGDGAVNGTDITEFSKFLCEKLGLEKINESTPDLVVDSGEYNYYEYSSISYNGQDFKSTVYQNNDEINQNEFTDKSERYKGYTDVNSEKQNKTATYNETFTSDSIGYNIELADGTNKNYSDAKDLWQGIRQTEMDAMQERTDFGSYCMSPRLTVIKERKAIHGRQEVIAYSNGDIDNNLAHILASPYKDSADENKINLMKALKDNTYMTAETGIISVEGEYNRQISTNEPGEGATGNNLNGNYVLANVDFGLVERPKAQLDLDKEVEGIKVFDQTGAVLFDIRDGEKGNNYIWAMHQSHFTYNGATSNKKYEDYYRDTDKHRYSYRDVITAKVNKSDNGLIQITMDTEIMDGANIQITYKLRVTNSGEVDYDDKEFYYKGVESDENAHIVTTAATEVVDYVSKNLGFKSNLESNQGWNVKTKEDLAPYIDKTLLEGSLKNDIGDGDTEQKIFNVIITTDNMNTPLKPKILTNTGSAVEKTLLLTQTISKENQEDNLTYQNQAEILSTRNTVGRRMAFSIVGNEDPTDSEKKPTEIDASTSEKVMILSPYGENKKNYYMIGLTVAIVLAGGIAFIIRKVLRK